MAVVTVGVVRVGVLQRRVNMPVAVRLTVCQLLGLAVGLGSNMVLVVVVQVVSVEGVRMRVCQIVVRMKMGMALAQMQPDAHRHERCRKPKEERRSFGRKYQRNERPQKRRDRKIGTRAQRPTPRPKPLPA